MRIRVGTRGSRLARIQSEWVAARLRAAGHEPEMVIVRTTGDRVQDRAFAEVGSPGLFVAEIERALLEERIDCAVHSYKDVPSASPPELVIAAVPERVDPADRLLAREEALVPGGTGLDRLAQAARLGTASARRQALVRSERPDIRIELLRGNLPTRVRQVQDGHYDAILLAAAGLDRLDRAAEADPGLALPRDGLVELRLDPERFVPAPSQGALAVQVRRADEAAVAAVDALDDRAAHAAVRAERALLERVQGGCTVPFGAWCRRLDDGRYELRGFLEREGRRRFVAEQGDEPLGLVEPVWSALTAV